MGTLILTHGFSRTDISVCCGFYGSDKNVRATIFVEQTFLSVVDFMALTRMSELRFSRTDIPVCCRFYGSDKNVRATILVEQTFLYVVDFMAQTRMSELRFS